MTTPMTSRPMGQRASHPDIQPISQQNSQQNSRQTNLPGREKTSAGSAKWRIAGASVRGATHIHNQLVNQDAIALHKPQPGQSGPLLIAISDGHGGKKYIRSDVGSRLAVQSAQTVLQDFHDARRQETNISAVKRDAEERLPVLLERTWREEVGRYLETHPFQEEEYETLVANGFPDCREELAQNPHLAFGATLLAVLVAQNYVLYIQIGDGDILAVDAGGCASRPLPPLDNEPIGEETFSLCQQNARQYFQIRVVPLEDRFPVMILASTDGLSKSYAQDEGFLKIGSHLLTLVREEGILSVSEGLEAMLNEISRAGSGDDITLGLIKRAETGEADTTNERILALEKQLGEAGQDKQAVEHELERARQEVTREVQSMSSLLETQTHATNALLRAMQTEVDKQKNHHRATLRRVNITVAGLIASSGIAVTALGLDIQHIRSAPMLPTMAAARPAVPIVGPDRRAGMMPTSGSTVRTGSTATGGATFGGNAASVGNAFSASNASSADNATSANSAAKGKGKPPTAAHNNTHPRVTAKNDSTPFKGMVELGNPNILDGLEPKQTPASNPENSHDAPPSPQANVQHAKVKGNSAPTGTNGSSAPSTPKAGETTQTHGGDKGND